jgi:class 3 adenylate cyclase
VTDAKQAHIQYADIINKAGRVVNVSSATIQSAMDDYADAFSDRFVVDIVDGAGVNSYPIAGYTYLIIRLTSMPNCSSAVELWRYIDWFNHEPQASETSESLNFVPLSDKVVVKVKTDILEQLKCRAQSVAELAEKQKQKELHSTQAWRTIIPITVPIAAVFCIALLVYVTVQQIKTNRAVLRNEWKISLNRLKFYTEKTFNQKTSRKSIQTTNSSICSLQTYGVARDNIAILDGEQRVSITDINLSNTQTLRLRTRRGLLWMRDHIEDINVSKFYGLCEKAGTLYCLTMYPAKGPLCDILQDDKYKLDANFQYSMACDIASGMQYLIKHNLVHGNLSSHTCYIDEKWNVKVGDWHLNQISVLEQDPRIRSRPINACLKEDDNVLARTKFWTAPEMLTDPHLQPTKETDVYSFAVVIVEIFSREDAFSHEESLQPKDIIQAIQTTGLRPHIPDTMHKALAHVIQKAWTSDPNQRPSIAKIKKKLEATKPSKKSVMDCMMEALEDYVSLLEDKVQDRTKELEIAIQQSTDLLNRMLPPQISKKLAAGEAVTPELYDEATVFFSDIVGFTALSSESTPMEIVAMLNDLYTTFDAVVDQHEVYKVETIGDAYMVISGAPARNGNMHAAHIASMAIGLAVASKNFVIRHRPNKKLEYRAGIHSGSVCTGVVGIRMPRYCIFGDTVNTASRMESTSISGKIQVSQNTKDLVCETDGFIMEPRGTILVKV